MKQNSRLIYICLIFIAIPTLLLACNNGNARSERAKATATNQTASTKIEETKIGKVTIYLENSESMFGYVNGITDYVAVVSELAEKPEFVMENTAQDFYFINGEKPTLTPIGTKASVLKNKLNDAGFRCGDITKSNLNGMFQIALQNAKNNQISILISDGIYDIGGQGLSSLVTEGTATRSEFIKRLHLGDLETIMIKLNSQFRGNYFYASKPGKIAINSTRPYYIWIFGDSKLLNKYFSNEYITGKLKGYETMARFMKPGSIVVPYQATTENLAGTFAFDRKEKNSLINAKVDRLGQGFRFGIAVDYSILPFPESFLTDTANYNVNNNYKVISIKKPAKKIYAVSFNTTHLITVHTKKSPYGSLDVSLSDNIPSWIAASDTNTEANIQTDKVHTFGLKYLTKGIIEAYESISQDKNIANFKIEIR